MRQKLKDRLTTIFWLVFILFIIIIFPVSEYIKGYERVIRVDKDAFVYEYTSDVNYGSEDYLRVGRDMYGKIYTYYHFNISSHSSEWKEAWIYVKFDYGTNLIDIGANLTLNNWDEMTITWNNRPEPTTYKGHILCDGFDFRIPIDLDQIVDGGVSVCLYGKQEGEEGYIQGYSKEGASFQGQMASIELSYTGFDPIAFWTVMRGLILIFSIIGLIVLAVILAKHSKPIRVKRKHKSNKLPQNIAWNKYIQNHANVIAKKIGPPEPPQMIVNEILNRYYPRAIPTLEKQINRYITLKLEYGRTFIYVNGRRFIQCIRLVLNIQKEDIPLYDEIGSIDEAAKVYKNTLYQNRIVQGPMATPVRDQNHDITPEQEFWGHCSNLQAWVENEYDTRILMSNISFPLLRELSKAGDPVAKRVYKEEIALRLESGYPSVVQYLLAQGYIREFSPDEFKTILESTNLIQKLSSDSRVLASLLNTCLRKFPTLIENIVLQVLNLPNSKDLLLSIINRDIPLYSLPESLQSYIKLSTIQFLIKLESILENLSKQVDEEKRENILNCVKAINVQLSRYDIDSILSKRNFSNARFQPFQNPLFKNVPLEQFDIDKIKAKVFEAKNKVPSRCAFCGKIIPIGKEICEWCGHKKDDDDKDGFFPHLFIFKPPGGGDGSMKGVAVVHNKSKA